jgi:hypothetical protein
VFLLALVAVLLAPALLVAERAPTAAPAGTSARASLTITNLEPLSVTGRGFKADERVTVRFELRRRATTATGAGRFVVRFANPGCSGGTIVAVGSKGSRAVANYSQLLCVEP